MTDTNDGGPSMEGHEEPAARRAGDAHDELAEDASREHPASPEQTGTGFEQGFDQRRDTPAEQQGPDFARGIDDGVGEEASGQRRFSEGIEQSPDTPDKTVERRFSEGIERSPT